MTSRAVAPLTAIFPRFDDGLLVVVLVVVCVLSVPRNPARMLCGVVFTNCSILRLTGVPVVPTIAPESRT